MQGAAGHRFGYAGGLRQAERQTAERPYREIGERLGFQTIALPPHRVHRFDRHPQCDGQTDHEGGVVVNQIIGDVSGRPALIVDDFTITGGTLMKVAEQLLEGDATDVCAAVTHGVFTPECMRRLDEGPIRRLLVTDTIETQPVTLSKKVKIASVAPLFAEAIRRIHTRQSISVLFEQDGGEPP